jgi:hypothetical protein
MSSLEQDAEFTAYLLERLDDCGLLDEWREDFNAKPTPAQPVIVFQLTINQTPVPMKPITEADIAKLAKYLDDM